MVYLRKERGASIVVILMSLMTVSVSVIAGMNYQVAQKQALQHQERRLEALQQARQNLIAYSVLYADNYPASGAGPGHFPCPDLDPPDDGIESNDGPNPPCNTAAKRLGRMPRFTYSNDFRARQSGNKQPSKRLEFFPPKSLLDQQLWYLVSDTHINNPLGRVVNPGTQGSIRTGNREQAIAVIISPGSALEHQAEARPSEQVGDYLESVAVDVTGKNFSVLPQGNDLITAITPSDIRSALIKRVSGHIVEWFKAYSRRVCPQALNPCFPYAGRSDVCEADLLVGTLPIHPGNCEQALTTDGALEQVTLWRHWFLRNEWSDFVRYDINANCLMPSTTCELMTQTIVPKSNDPAASEAVMIAVSAVPKSLASARLPWSQPVSFQPISSGSGAQ